MSRLLTLVFFLALLVGCDSAEDPADAALLSVAVETPSGTPVGGLDLSMEYTLGGGGEGRVGYSDVVAEASRQVVALHVGYPNPFVTATTLEFALPEAAEVTMEVLDLEGRPAVQREGLPAGYLLQEDRPAGLHAVNWEVSADLTGGFYRVRLIADEDTASVLSVFGGRDASPHGERRLVTSALGQTDEMGRFATDDRARFPQRYPGLEVEYRDENNVFFGVLQPSNEITLILRDEAGREQRYERVLTGSTNTFELTWNPE